MDQLLERLDASGANPFLLTGLIADLRAEEIATSDDNACLAYTPSSLRVLPEPSRRLRSGAMGLTEGAAGLLEREDELSELDAVLADARAGRGRTLVIEGAAGVGKTELLRATAERGAAAGMQVLAARCGEFERELAYDLVHQLFAPALREMSADERARVLADAAGLAAPLFETGAAEDVEVGALLRGLYWLTYNLAERTPLLLVVDDVHWADAASLRFLAYLAPRLEELPVALVVALRPAEGAADDPRLHAVRAAAGNRTLAPSPLSATGVGAFVEARLARPISERFRVACVDATGGNPLLVRELTAELANGGIPPTDEHAADIAALAPRSIVRSVLVRLARIGPGASELAQALAVLGDGAELRVTADVAGLDVASAAQLADELARHDILAPGRPLSYAHPLLRAAVRDDIAAGTRAALHQRVARVLTDDGGEPETIAVHLLHCDAARDPQTVETLRRAARASRSRAAHEAAIAYLERALAEPPPAAVAPTVLGELAASEAMGGRPGAGEHGVEALERGAEPHSVGAAAMLAAGGLLLIDEAERAIELAERAIAAAARTDRDFALVLTAELIAAARTLVDPAWVQARIEGQAQDYLEARTPGQRAMLASTSLVRAEQGEGPLGAADLAARALSGGLLRAEPGHPALAWGAGVMTLILADRLDAADSELEAALAGARRSGSLPGLVSAGVYRTLSAWRRGDLARVETSGRDTLNAAAEAGWVGSIAAVAGLIAMAQLERGAVDEAETELQAAGALETLPPARSVRASWWIAAARGWLRAARGDAPGAAADLLDAAARLPPRGQVYGFASSAAVMLAGAGDRERALKLIADELALARKLGLESGIAVTLRAQGLVTGGEEGLELLRESVALLERAPTVLERVRSLIELGSALRRANQRAAARAPLRAGHELARRCGSTALAERAVAELEATGERVERRRGWGVDALTPSERRVAALAAEGLTNPQIAQQLFVTVKTVEHHLSRSYVKLDIKRRGELGDALAAVS